MNTYECSICHGINHVARLHCQTCGTIPAQYSGNGKALSYHSDQTQERIVNTVPAINCDRAERHRNARINLRTVAADYYAGE